MVLIVFYKLLLCVYPLPDIVLYSHIHPRTETAFVMLKKLNNHYSHQRQRDILQHALQSSKGHNKSGRAMRL